MASPPLFSLLGPPAGLEQHDTTLLSPPHPPPALLPQAAPSLVPRLDLDGVPSVFGSALLDSGAPVYRGVSVPPPALSLQSPVFDSAPPRLKPSQHSPFLSPHPASPVASARLFLEPGSGGVSPLRPKPLCLVRQVLSGLPAAAVHQLFALGARDADPCPLPNTHHQHHHHHHHHPPPHPCPSLRSSSPLSLSPLSASLGSGVDAGRGQGRESPCKRKRADDEDGGATPKRRCISPWSLSSAASHPSVSDWLENAASSSSSLSSMPSSPSSPRLGPSPLSDANAPFPNRPAAPSLASASPPASTQQCCGEMGARQDAEGEGEEEGEGEGEEEGEPRGLSVLLRGVVESLGSVVDNLVRLSAPGVCNPLDSDHCDLVRACACLPPHTSSSSNSPHHGSDLPFPMPFLHGDEDDEDHHHHHQQQQQHGGSEGGEGWGVVRARLLDQQLDAMVRLSEEERPRPVDLVDTLKTTPCAQMRRHVLLLHLLGELKFVLGTVHDVLHADAHRRDAPPSSSSSSSSPSPSPSFPATRRRPGLQLPNPACGAVLYRLFVAVLYCVVCRHAEGARLLDRPENRAQRNWAMAAFFRALLRPVPRANCPTIVLLSKVGLACLDAKHKKIPREVVESVLRPALMQFCDVGKLTMPLIVGLHSVVGLFPTLFKEVFGKKIVGLLEDLSGAQPAQREHQAQLAHGLGPRGVRAVVVHLLDFFRLFAATCSFSCERWVDRLCRLVVQLEARWGPVASPGAAGGAGAGAGAGAAGGSGGGSGGGCSGVEACSGFRAPLCRFLCHYPAAAVAAIMHRVSDSLHGAPFADVFRSILRCRHAVPLVEEYERRACGVLAAPSPALPAPPCAFGGGGGGNGGCGDVLAPACAVPLSFAAFRHEDALADVELVVGPSEVLVRAHRVVLASASAHFARLLQGGGRLRQGQGRARVLLPEAEEPAFGVVLDFVYGTQPDLAGLDPDALCAVHRLARRFALRRLVDKCEHALGALVSPHNWRRLARAALAQCRAGGVVVHSCGGAGGEGLLRACQAHLLGNLGSLAPVLELDDAAVVHLLANDHRVLVDIAMDEGACA